MPPLLQLRGVSKRFTGVVALDGVDFNAYSGKVHALMGENGAGKSTLIKALTGVHPRDAGEITLDGKHISPTSPREAEAVGVSTVYQEVNLIPDLSIAENICLGRQPKRLGLLRWAGIRERARAALARLGLEKLDVNQTLSACSIAIQQLVALARALDVDAKVLILDEPTSSLDAREVEELFAVVRKLRDQGMAIIFVSHFLDQVYSLADRITVLRNGKLVGEYIAAQLPRLQLVAHMMGRNLAEVEALQHRAPPGTPPGKTILETKQLGRKGSIEPTDLHVRQGEVLGFAGLLGSGRSELARLLFGVDHATSGELHVDGEKTSFGSPRDAIQRGFAFTPEDRKIQAILPNLTVRENLVIALQARRGLWSRLPRAEQDALVEKFIKVLKIKTSGPEQLIKNLSGGNQQKVILARWLVTEPRLLILDEPTRGIDVGAQADIERLLAELRDQGLAIVFICSDASELSRNSQRLIVLRDHAKVADLAGADVSEHGVMHAIAHSGPSAP